LRPALTVRSHSDNKKKEQGHKPMKNAFSRLGYTCAAAALFCAATSIASAATMNRITVNLPEDTVAGSSTLAAGAYTITDVEPAGGVHVFVFRGENGKLVTLQAGTIAQASESSKTSLVLSRRGSEFRLNKILIEGSSLGYEFDSGRQGDVREQK
jgi:hypothetical protein